MKEYLPFLFSTLMLLNYFTLPCSEHTQQNGRETSCDKRHKNFVWKNFPPNFTFPFRQIFLLKTRNVNFIVKWRSRQNPGLTALPCLSYGSPLLFLPSCCVLFTSEFTQQDGKKKRTAKRLCVTNVTVLWLACFVVIFTYINVFWSFTKRSV